ncbi:Auxin-responsive protein [Quillaja saponaria]|uniref:Auxin-induced protein n=1 Tax=Quillaja saponaria TaxID=32244 RepID=A0AAD7QCY3_QUISA|nr:Auxin-responsive protein [Quillaja saponaria]
MDLQLGLSLLSNPNPSNGFDLNCCTDKSNGVLYNSSTICNSEEHSLGQRQAFEQNREVPPTLPLLLLIPNQPNDHENPRDLYKNWNDAEENELMGWTPINSWRQQNHCHESYSGHDQGARNNPTVEITSRSYVDCREIKSNMYVKVKMEGMGITRKVDLSLHESFETLRATLMDMFGKCDENPMSYILTCQDKEGDWLLAEDLPWRSFIQSAQRLKLQKSPMNVIATKSIIVNFGN